RLAPVGRAKEAPMTAPASPWSAADVTSFLSDYYDAFSGTDEDRILSYYADDVVVQLPGSLIQGKAACRDEFVRPFMTAFPGKRHRTRSRWCGTGGVVVEFAFEAEHSGPFGGSPATGARISLPGCAVYQSDPSRRQMTACRIYLDVGTFLQRIAALPPKDP